MQLMDVPESIQYALTFGNEVGETPFVLNSPIEQNDAFYGLGFHNLKMNIRTFKQHNCEKRVS